MNQNRRDFLKTTSVLSAAGLATGLAHGAKSEESRSKRQKQPNLVYVFPDQMRRHAMGFMKQDPVLTPNLDKFAKRSVILDNACSTYPVCSPHRASLLTGQYPITTGFYSNCRGDRPDVFLNPETECFTDVLHNNGYHVGYIGKWHLERGEPGEGYASPWVAKERRHNIDFWHSWCNQLQDEYGKRIPWESDHFHFGYWVDDAGPEERHFPGPIWSAIYETNVAADYISNRNGERDADKPFALFVSWNPPHNPYDSVPQNYKELYKDATPGELLNRPNVSKENRGAEALEHVQGYFGAVTGVDDQFGRILHAIEEAGLEEDTIIVFTSDHGEMMGSHGEMGKPYVWEEAFGVPFLISWKNHLEARHEELLLGTPDIMPTLLGLMGLDKKIPDTVEGRDYSAALEDKPGAVRPEFAWYYNYWNARGLRTKDEGCYFYRDGRGRNVDYLFDLRNDPFQMENLGAAKVSRSREFGAEVKRWMKEYGDTFFSQRAKRDYLDTIPG
ncbi:sulfatase-like hydrolase/transferase [Pelagicoccus mobilis]|uniref:Sulfatase-like hydrolase/transferase n=1 Tax=Pelagicoccus mobilis TaxID=415221 RepID=A0A934VP80_9BACT|nr:sulfatase-like hydrolase/transferase [Pelagicoccus mobilis]MBK1875258.1 sulfatase-like hydrolase/transferase [Pelagicoccus mobilis]